jgi:hypothetical protein
VGHLVVDELHGALGHAVAVEEGLVRVGDHIDDGVADAHDIQGLLGHDCTPPLRC